MLKTYVLNFYNVKNSVRWDWIRDLDGSEIATSKSTAFPSLALEEQLESMFSRMYGQDDLLVSRQAEGDEIPRFILMTLSGCVVCEFSMIEKGGPYDNDI